MDRVLPYEESENIVNEYPKSINNPHADAGASRSVFNHFSFFAGVDHKNRLWVGTYSRQSTKEERDTPFEEKTNIDSRMFEIYDSDGILLYRLNPNFPKHSSQVTFKLIGDKLFAIDSRAEMAIFEYRIVEN